MLDLATDYKMHLRFTAGKPQHLVLPDEGMSTEQFLEFCAANPDLRIERDDQHQIVIMPPTTSETGRKNASISGELYLWNRKHRLGVVFDSSTGFHLPNGADRSPDAAWIQKERWEALPDSERSRFAAIVPDFVIELRSAEQSLADLKAKMEEYLDNGAQLGWLIDPTHQITYVYSANGPAYTCPFDAPLSGGDVLPGLEMVLLEVFAT
jgi:Uma2 family endonuclease